MTARRAKFSLILAGLAFGALLLLAWTQAWFTVSLASGQQLSVAGQAAAPALSALGLASLALAAALSIAGPVFRAVLGVIQAGIGVLAVVTSASALGGPVAASASTVTDATAVSGAQSVAALVASVSASAWPWLALVTGALATLVGLAVLFTSRRWPGATRKYEARAEEPTSNVGAWDALSEGRDPTTR